MYAFYQKSTAAFLQTYLVNDLEIKITSFQLLSYFTKYRNHFPPPTTFSVEHCVLAKSKQPLRSLRRQEALLCQKAATCVTKRDVKLHGVGL